MKTSLAALSAATLLALTATAAGTAWTAGFQDGSPGFKSISQLAFGPEGILFAADTKAAAIVAVDTGDTTPAKGSAPLKIEALNQKLAALLGTVADEILIDDLAVNPVSHRAYLAVSRGRGPEALPALVRADASGTLEVVPLERVKFSRAELTDAPADALIGTGQRQGNPRLESITDIAFIEDRVVVAGLSNEEFSSTLRSIPFPFRTVAGGTGVEIYHGAHGRYETRAPIRTFVPFTVGNRPQLLAAYTCTPLVQIPLGDLKAGAKVKGKTIAELGNRNRPLDIISYEKDGKTFLLLANSARGVIKVSTEGIDTAESISEPVKDGATRGLAHETITGWTGVNQLDRLDANTVVVVRHTAAGLDTLESLALP
jgi:hypothetical protein